MVAMGVKKLLFLPVCASLLAPAQGAVFDVDYGGGGVELLNLFFTFTVSGLSQPISDVDLRISAAHPRIDQLHFELESPVSPHFFQWNNLGVQGANFQDTYLDDEAGGARLGQPGSQIGPFAGPEWGGQRYRAPSDLSIFDGINGNGTWLLKVGDFTPDGSDWSLFKSGQVTPWGTAIGMQLIITTVPEPSICLAIVVGACLFSRTRRDGRRIRT